MAAMFDFHKCLIEQIMKFTEMCTVIMEPPIVVFYCSNFLKVRCSAFLLIYNSCLTLKIFADIDFI